MISTRVKPFVFRIRFMRLVLLQVRTGFPVHNWVSTAEPLASQVILLVLSILNLSSTAGWVPT